MNSPHRRFFRQFIWIGLLLAVVFAQPVPAAKPRTGSGVDDLPLVNVAARQPGNTLAILLTGDGGWADLDRTLSSALAAHGITVIGWDSLRYYWPLGRRMALPGTWQESWSITGPR